MPSAPRLEKITPDNVTDACRLRVRPEQAGFVESVAESLAEAYASPDIAWPRLVCDGEEAVGFVMAFFDVPFDFDGPGAAPRSGLWRLAVSADHQGAGYGRFAVAAVCDEVRRRGGSTVTVTYKPGDHGPEGFYARLGFRALGMTDDGEVLAEMDLPERDLSWSDLSGVDRTEAERTEADRTGSGPTEVGPAAPAA
ncbi:GNAT family N-acetyltransferase [Streptomyces kanasensis]|uniref:GNAT family N-acetyltransferase n=1 Tax=Streptomyces kanasensis TaxID=936756 RepID=UPI00380C30AD